MMVSAQPYALRCVRNSSKSVRRHTQRGGLLLIGIEFTENSGAQAGSFEMLFNIPAPKNTGSRAFQRYRMTLQATMVRVHRACWASGLTIRKLFDLPLPLILAFANRHQIAVQDLKDICWLMMESLDALEAELAMWERPALH